MRRTLAVAACAALCALALTCKKDPPVVPNGGIDTTTHAFSFYQVDTLGDGNASILCDVIILTGLSRFPEPTLHVTAISPFSNTTNSSSRCYDDQGTVTTRKTNSMMCLT